jgi:hypothetical protein
MNKQNDNRYTILEGASDTLKMLWQQRDNALDYEKRNDITPRTSQRFVDAQKQVDEYFNPKEPKAQRRKPKKKPYVPEDGWAY